MVSVRLGLVLFFASISSALASDPNCTRVTASAHPDYPPYHWREGGRIVNIGSMAGEWPYPGGNVYGATKAFVRQFSLNLRADLLGTAVRVSNIEPGMAGGTEFSNVRFHGDDAQAAQVYADVQPLTAEDVAEATYWITTLPAHVNINTLAMMPTAHSALTMPR